MTNRLHKTLFFSFLGHLAAFSIFSFSFGNRLMKVNYPQANFLGQVLDSRLDLRHIVTNIQGKHKVNIEKEGYFVMQNNTYNKDVICGLYYKPLSYVSPAGNKLNVQKADNSYSLPPKRKQEVMLYPELPYQFMLYFKDRQVVHIEVLFNNMLGNSFSPVVIKRGISSGNLEADLLCMRYLGHYLFIKAKSFKPNYWHRVKIDLSK
ncbi:hypothetical protein EPO66_05605 [bacterium]|nr:MAG: hypothetical protein EPO66_05605 [bacterium]